MTRETWLPEERETHLRIATPDAMHAARYIPVALKRRITNLFDAKIIQNKGCLIVVDKPLEEIVAKISKLNEEYRGRFFIGVTASEELRRAVS